MSGHVEDHAQGEDGVPYPLEFGMKGDGFPGPASFGSRFRSMEVLDLTSDVALNLELIGAHICCFDLRLQKDADIIGKLGIAFRQSRRVAVVLRPWGGPPQSLGRLRGRPASLSAPALPCGGTPSSIPVAIILAMSRRQSVIRSRASLMARASASISAARASNSSARATSGERSKPTKLELPFPALPRIAFAVWTVATEHEPGVDEACQMAARRSRHPMSQQGSSLDGKTIKSSPDSVVSDRSSAGRRAR